MIRALYALIVSSLSSAVFVFGLCFIQCLQGNNQTEQNSELSIIEKHKYTGGNEKSNQQTISPLVKQAKSFALYLNPPEPTKRNVDQSLKTNAVHKNKSVRPESSKPKFTLVATSYYHAKPEESMALISEPGSGFRWVKQGSHLGHFVVEKVEPGTLVFQDGECLLEMLVATKGCDNIVRTHHKTTSLAKSSTTNEQNTQAITASDKLDPTELEVRPKALTMVSEQEVSNIQLGASNE